MPAPRRGAPNLAWQHPCRQPAEATSLNLRLADGAGEQAGAGLSPAKRVFHPGNDVFLQNGVQQREKSTVTGYFD